jgi:hypothetical protein
MRHDVGCCLLTGSELAHSHVVQAFRHNSLAVLSLRLGFLSQLKCSTYISFGMLLSLLYWGPGATFYMEPPEVVEPAENHYLLHFIVVF